MAPHYRVCRRGQTPQGRTLRMVGKPISKLEAARAYLQEVRPNIEGPLAIYRFTYGKVPEFIEGDNLH